MKRKFMEGIIGNKAPSEMQNFIWNMLGSLVTAMSTMVLSLFVINTIGPEEGGVFAIALTLSQMLMYIAYFEMRTFQVTDVTKKYLFGEYHATKIFLCILMLLISAAYIVAKQYYFKKGMIILLVCLWKDLDGYADVYESQFQTEGRLDLAGKSMAFRMLLSVAVFFLVLLLTKSLITSLIVVNGIAVSGILIFDIAVMDLIGKVELSFNVKKIRDIIKECMPLFVGIFCWVYILSASRIAIDNNMSSVYQSYYQILFLPVSVINLFAGFVFKPLLPKLATYYEMGKKKDFYLIIKNGIVCLGGITIVCMAGAFLIGVPVLSFLSGCDLKPYKMLLVFLILTGGINAVDYTLYYVLTIMREMKVILSCYMLSALTALLISNPLVGEFGMWGGAGSYLIVNILLCIMFIYFILRKNKKKENLEGKNKYAA